MALRSAAASSAATEKPPSTVTVDGVKKLREQLIFLWQPHHSTVHQRAIHCKCRRANAGHVIRCRPPKDPQNHRQYMRVSCHNSWVPSWSFYTTSKTMSGARRACANVLNVIRRKTKFGDRESRERHLWVDQVEDFHMTSASPYSVMPVYQKKLLVG